MVLWRVSNCRTLDGVGGLYVSGRWHTKGHPIVYCTLNPATALLEILVHMEIDSEDRPERFQVLRIEGPDALSIEETEPDALPSNWVEDIVSTQSMGDLWLYERRSLLLKVPSVLVPETWNVLVNPQHAEANLLKVTTTYEQPFDARLFDFVSASGKLELRLTRLARYGSTSGASLIRRRFAGRSRREKITRAMLLRGTLFSP